MSSAVANRSDGFNEIHPVHLSRSNHSFAITSARSSDIAVPDSSARDCHQHERREDDADQRCHEQVDHQCWQLALYKTPPHKARSVRGWLIVNRHKMGIHRSSRSSYSEVLTAIGASLYPMNGAIALSVAEPTRSPGSYFSGGRIS
jgi:hypothetical protein